MLAAEPRVLVTRDVETGRASSVQVCVRGGGGGGEGGGGGGGGVEEMRGRTPCILPEWSSIQEVSKEETGGREMTIVELHLFFSFDFCRLKFAVLTTGQ